MIVIIYSKQLVDHLRKKFLKENIIKVRFITNYISNVLHSFKFNFATVSPH